MVQRSIANSFYKKFHISKTEIRSIKMLKTIILPPSNYLITYYQTLYEVIWLLRQEKLNKRQMS